MFLVTFGFGIVQLAANQAFGVEHSIFRVSMERVLGGVTDTARINAELETLFDGWLEREGHTVVPRRRTTPMKE